MILHVVKSDNYHQNYPNEQPLRSDDYDDEGIDC